ncbi:MAG: DUF5686 and carboxypeptidase regulatory-like domain-containing protein [Bacteroidales bacterium]|nr:DUF5686 and carboxypeptidase regulatory-like domain-containing protein [Bacteroidales bacterium]
MSLKTKLMKPSGIRILLFFLLVFQTISLLAQDYMLAGRVVDQQTREPLAFVNIVIDGTRQGGVTDIDGFFQLTHSQPIERIILSYVGYYQKVFETEPGRDLQWVEMQRRLIELAVVEVFPGENPAHRIIENAIAQRDRNNPEKLGSFSYESYNKFVFTGEFDRASPELPGLALADTISGRLERFLDERHFMIMETVTERRFRYPSRNTETVLASRISGFENPVLALMATQFQSFSFYEDHIIISGQSYLSPLSPGSTSRYFFLLEDTTFTQTDTVFIISFRPSRGRNFEGLSGVFYINSNGWAVQNVIAEPARQQGNSRVRIQQMYELIDGRSWFPTQLNTDVEILNVPNINHFRLLGLGRTYLRNIKLEPNLTRRDLSSYAIEFSPNTIVRDPDFWIRNRPDSLSLREELTYAYLDSMGQKQNLDRQLDRVEALIGGAFRRGIFDVELKHLIGFNDQEGWRPGLGLSTNSNLSNRFSIHGNIGYGLKSETLRYGWGGEVLLDRMTNFRLGYDFYWDFLERGGSFFLENTTLWSPYNIRRYFWRDMDMLRRHRAWLGLRTFRNFLTVQAFVSDENQKSNPNYIYLPAALDENAPANQFRFFETGLMMRLAVGEQFVLTPTRSLAFGTDFPVVYLNLSKGWSDVFNGNHDYWRAEMKFERRFRIKMAGIQKWVLQAGYVHGDPPWPKLFTGQASYRRFAVSAPQSFATMRMAEFVSDRYINLFFYHNFEKLLWNRPGFAPGLVLLTNIGLGSLGKPNLHAGYEIKSMEKGYFESGFAITDLIGSGLTSLGVEFMYRYGPYALPDFKDNFSLRLSYSFMFR